MANQIISKSAESSFIRQITITSNQTGDSIDISTGTIQLMYYESILQDTVKASVTFVDTGNSVNEKTVLEGLPMVGQENVRISFEDNSKVKLELTLYTNKINSIVDSTVKNMVQLDLVSKEFILNEKIRLINRFDGKISDHIRRILTDQNYLSTAKDVDIEETLNYYNFIGNNKKPYYAMNWLSKKAIPNLPDAKGNTAGYFFFETSEGFKFKSIDSMLSQENKKSIIYNETPDSRGINIPPGYDIKALDYSKDNRIDVQERLSIGAFSTRTILFDPFNCYYEVITPNAKEKEGSLKKAGKDLAMLNKEFDRPGANKEFSRTTYYLIDRGTIPTGDTKQQIEKSEEPNFEVKDILNQAIMRYNQLYSIKLTITIPGDFSLHAGDAVFLDVPEITSKNTKKVSKENGGLYIIADLCHYVSTNETYTKLNLVRDSFGRIGNHTSGRIPL
jgi:hypothetical protein